MDVAAIHGLSGVVGEGGACSLFGGGRALVDDKGMGNVGF